MKIQEIISRIEAYHSFIPDYEKNPRACDGVKYGDPTGECTGIASAIDASVDVIRKAGQAGCNFLYVHEPTFYTHWDTTDWLAGDPVYRAKTELLDRYGMVVYRDHDHQHADDDAEEEGVAGADEAQVQGRVDVHEGVADAGEADGAGKAEEGGPEGEAAHGAVDRQHDAGEGHQELLGPGPGQQQVL